MTTWSRPIRLRYSASSPVDFAEAKSTGRCGFPSAVSHAAAAEYLAMRERVFRRIGAAGVTALDVEPERLPILLVNRYLELKREGRL